MKLLLNSRYWLFLLLVSCLACNMQQEVEIELPPPEQDLIVECYLEPGEPFRALVTSSSSFYEETQLSAVDSAEISISTGDTSRKLYTLNHVDTNYNKVFNYWHHEKVQYKEGQEYQISIRVEGDLIASGKTRFLPKPTIINSYFKHDNDSMAAAFVEIADNPNEENYYRVVLRSGSNPKVGVTYDGIWDDKKAENGKLLTHTPYVFKRGWSNVALNVYHIDKSYYEFLKSVKQARDANYNPFMQPASIRSTLDGATGVFTAISISSDTIAIE